MPFARSSIPERLHRTGAFPIPASLAQKVAKVEPAGRADVYDLTVDLTQNFALAAGIFVHNSIDDDPPGADRYTEARLAAISAEILADIDKNTVDFMPNYDNRHQQPTVLPARLPNLLLNGSAGIAVGMATNIPPHTCAGRGPEKRLIEDPSSRTTNSARRSRPPSRARDLYRFEETERRDRKTERVDGIRRGTRTGAAGSSCARRRTKRHERRREAVVVIELPYR